jgi:hypothetical protein
VKNETKRRRPNLRVSEIRQPIHFVNGWDTEINWENVRKIEDVAKWSIFYKTLNNSEILILFQILVKLILFKKIDFAMSNNNEKK